MYAFYPTTGDTTTEVNGVPGNKSKLSQAVRNNPLLHEKYTVVDLKEVRKNQRERYKQNKMLRLQKESTVNVPNETVK